MAGQVVAVQDNIAALLRKNSGKLTRMSGRALDVERFVSVVHFCLTKTPQLQQCTPVSLYRACLQAAEMGLVPGAANGDAYLVPFGREVTLIPGYMGLCRLALESGHIVSVKATAVFEGDTFQVIGGLHPDLRHEPGRCREPEKMTDVYVVWQTRDGIRDFDHMTREEVESIRTRAKAGNIWKTDYVAMAKKTVIRRASKLWPKSKQFQKALAHEVALDTGDWANLEYETEDAQPAEVQASASNERVQSARKNMRREDATVSNPAPTEKPLTPLQQWNRTYEASGLSARGISQATILKAVLGTGYTAEEPPTDEQCQVAMDSLPAYLARFSEATETVEEHGTPEELGFD